MKSTLPRRIGIGTASPIRNSCSGMVSPADPNGSFCRGSALSILRSDCAGPGAGGRHAPICPPGRPPSMRGATSTTMCGPTRRWPWRCPAVAITSVPDPIPLSCRRCPTGPTTRSARSRPRRLGVLPGTPAPTAQSLARPVRGLSPDAHRWLLGHPLSDRRPGHAGSAGAGLGVHHVSEHLSTMCPVWTSW